MNSYSSIKGDEIQSIEQDEIQAPDELNTPSDFEQLFLHVISHFNEEIDAYGRNKTQLLSSIKSILTEYIPAVYPQYFANYPDSLPDIYALVKETIKINQERSAALPSLYALMEESLITPSRIPR
jgi:hypothetical protein